MNRTVLLIICCALLTLPSFGQSPQNLTTCSPIGVWYSEGYVLTINPITESRFSFRAEPVYDVSQLGLKSWTSWPGQLVQKSGNSYSIQAIQMSTSTTDVIELVGIHGSMEFKGCKNIEITYDFFGGYFDLSKEPFVDIPDVNYLPPEGIIENYHRMPKTCPACQLPNTAVSRPQQRR